MYISYREALTSNEKEDMDKNRCGAGLPGREGRQDGPIGYPRAPPINFVWAMPPSF